MQRAAIDLESDADETGPDRTALGEALGATDVAVNHYRLSPGEGFPSGLHAHVDQEEVFVVLAGEAVFETYLPAAGVESAGTEFGGLESNGRDSDDADAPIGREVVVAAGEAVRFAPGEFQTGRNSRDSDHDLVALALGAPADTEDVRIPADCPECGDAFLQLGTGGEAFTFDCPDCESSFTPAPCQDCGEHALGMHLDADGRPVSACENCGREHANPPLEP